LSLPREKRMETKNRKKKTQGILFDVLEGEEGRAAGIRYACSPEGRKIALKEAQKVAVEIAKRSHDRLVTADDVSKWYATIKRMDLGLELGNAMGALFPRDTWEWSGDVVNAEKVRSHARILRVWRWKGKEIA
jgi:hypothetical protein